MFEVCRSDEYNKLFIKLSRNYQHILERFEDRLCANPYIGKQLTYEFFREKKFDNRRALFFIYPEHRKVLLLTIVTKETQESAMKWLRKNLDTLKTAIPNKPNEHA
ncbi:hypothetical protein C4580_04340 [Candidatus Woesearchaeota archaeon]|nr:MAG: hypothetical protein C4580_04340 [Candidatus Woesearchaeota archaeon]